MVRLLRKGVFVTLLFAGLLTPAAAADPILMFLLGMARDMIVSQVAKSSFAPAAEPLPERANVYPGTAVEHDHLRRLVDDSFPYLSSAQRKEIFAALHEGLMHPRNAAVRGTMIEYFAQKALTVRAAQQKLAQLSSGEKQRLAAGFREEFATLSAEEQTQLGELLRNGLLPIPSDLNQMLLATFEAPR